MLGVEHGLTSLSPRIFPSDRWMTFIPIRMFTGVCYKAAVMPVSLG